MTCPTEDLYTAYAQSAIRVAQLVTGDPDGHVLDRAVERFVRAEAAFLAQWEGHDEHAA